MSHNDRDEKLIETVREHLDAGAADLDGRVCARLRAMRADALEEAARRRGWFFRLPRWVTAGGLATAVAAVVAVSLWVADVRRERTVATIDDMELITAQEQMQLYEDLDFYRWLAEQDTNG